MNFLQIIKDELKLDLSNIKIEPWDIDNSGFEFEIKPKDFLRFAKQDFLEKNQKGFINSLTNSKRAIDCQIDTTLNICGIDFDNISDASSDFINMSDVDKKLPYKLQLISSLGFAPSGLVSNVRNLRNKMEHYYQNPSETSVKEALELAELFTTAVGSKIFTLHNGFVLSDEKNYSYDEEKYRAVYNNALFIKYESSDRNFTVNKNLNGENVALKVKIDQNSKEYYFLMFILNCMFDELDLHNAILFFLKYIKHPIPEKHVKIEIE